MIDTGGTLIKALELLKENGAKKCVVVATHGLFSGVAITKFAAHPSNPTLLTTDTLPVDEIYHRFEGFGRISVIGEFDKALKKIFTV